MPNPRLKQLYGCNAGYSQKIKVSDLGSPQQKHRNHALLYFVTLAYVLWCFVNRRKSDLFTPDSATNATFAATLKQRETTKMKRAVL